MSPLGKYNYRSTGDLEGGIRAAIKQSRNHNPTQEWKQTGQLHALAVFMRAIHEGKVESLYSLFEPDTNISDKQLIDVLVKINRGLEIVYSVPNK